MLANKQEDPETLVFLNKVIQVYTDEELKDRKGWGHSSYRQAIEVAKLSGAKRLIMTHHDPDHDDDFLADMEQKCQKEFPNSCLSKEMMEVYI